MAQPARKSLINASIWQLLAAAEKNSFSFTGMPSIFKHGPDAI